MSSIGRNTLYNLAGYAVPLVLFLATIPAYIHFIGADRYGVLAIVWLIYGGFGMLDLGLGRAATQRIAALRDADPAERRAMLDVALSTNVVIGAVGAILTGLVGWFTFAIGMKLDPSLRTEALEVVPLMALGLPIITTLGILSGALQARERFLITNRITITNSALFQLLPLVVAWLVAPTLWLVVLAALAARMTAVVLLLRECRREFGPRSAGRPRRPGEAWDMLRYGGWVTLSSLGGLINGFSDRLLIGALIGPVAVTIYTVPMDATRRLAVIADSLSNAMFPRLAVTDEEGTRVLAERSTAALYAVATPVVACFVVMAEPLVRLWLGDRIGAQSAPLAQILAVAAWANMFAKLPYAQLQAQGRPHLVALTQLAEIPLYVAGLVWAVRSFGLPGAAWLYIARTSIDAAILTHLAERRMIHGALLGMTLAALCGLVWLAQLAGQPSWPTALIATAAVGLGTALIAWLVMPHPLRQLALGFAGRFGPNRTAR